ncbi:hypothetical protein P4050_14625 [Pseudomonas aeruginosa]|nr:hypothetical protein [Pseudomonas aeruginosa]
MSTSFKATDPVLPLVVAGSTGMGRLRGIATTAGLSSAPLFLRTLPRRGWLDIWMARGKLSRPPLAALSAKSKAMVFASNGSAGCRGTRYRASAKASATNPFERRLCGPHRLHGHVSPATVRSGPLVIGSDQIIAGTSRTVILQEPGTVTMDVQPFISMAGQSNVFIFGNGMQINGQKNEARSGEGRYGLFIYGSKKSWSRT